MTTQIIDPHAAATVHLLAWYREMGVDAALNAEAIDWTARGAARPGDGFVWPEMATGVATSARTAPAMAAPERRAAVPNRVDSIAASTGTRPAASPPRAPQSGKPELRPLPVTGPRQFPTAAPDAAVMAARAAARSAKSLDDLRAQLTAFEGCALKSTAKTLCFFRGAATSRIMLIGDAPTSDDDQLGRPISGAEGELLDRMLAAIGLVEADVHIANAVYWRPPGNRRPTAVELAVCRPFLERQIELVAPAYVVLLGELPVQHLYDSADKIMKVRGTWRPLTVGQHTAKVLPILHPSYLLKSPAAKRLAWADLRALKSALEGGT